MGVEIIIIAVPETQNGWSLDLNFEKFNVQPFSHHDRT